jgi:hypothetical protein
MKNQFSNLNDDRFVSHRMTSAGFAGALFEVVEQRGSLSQMLKKSIGILITRNNFVIA